MTSPPLIDKAEENPPVEELMSFQVLSVNTVNTNKLLKRIENEGKEKVWFDER